MSSPRPVTPCIVVHGGAGQLSNPSIFPMLIIGVKKAARAGYDILMRDGENAAVDAVEAAIKVMEDDSNFNAGHGSKLNTRGEVEMDAMIMDGRDLNYGGVGGISNIANPISVARKVMDESSHCLLIGNGANQFAQEKNFPQIPNHQLITESRRRQLARALEAMELVEMSEDESESDIEEPIEVHKTKKQLKRQQSKAEILKMVQEIRGKEVHDTVGAVAVDCQGNVACATSTGGLTAVHPGRVGDSPIAGCGGYADNHIGASSATGNGESILRVTLCRYALFMLQIGQTAADAAAAALRYMEQRVGGTAGIIMVSRDGDAGVAFNSNHMPWAQVKRGITSYGLNRGEIKTSKRRAERSESFIESPDKKYNDISTVTSATDSDCPLDHPDSGVVSLGMEAGASGGDVYINM
ncbi:isoaspartyl peptidase/L-asparaginase-like isoform X2 [Actinia tenebrosa]|uniref:Isoaspartyl peptidase/L-asparaginase-like isoform X2 n=1 Tax=Actinia tenebrosa TaxID=6105 RepID=A0A6P8I9R8_ACTTE|nr:isoaspartyl peptidase/L-asparaginase-like isoform X2 [Actinia tenebrosa]